MNAVIGKIGEIGIVPVIKIEKAENAIPLVESLVAGGLPCAEFTFRSDAAADSIARVAKAFPDFPVGAGTVINRELAERAVDSGARFIVSPGFNPAVVDWCLSRGIPVVPGVNNPSLVEQALERGLEVLKFFPAEASGGLAMLDALAGPYAGMRFVPTGGIDAGNLQGYARRPQVLAVGGSWMAKPDLVEAEDWEGIERLAREAVLALHGFSFAHLGINGADDGEARKAAGLLAALFGFALKEGASSIFAAEALELAKRAFPGEKGHIAIRCNDVERALARFEAMGVGSLPDTAQLEKGRLKAVYLDLSVGGFALRLLRA